MSLQKFFFFLFLIAVGVLGWLSFSDTSLLKSSVEEAPLIAASEAPLTAPPEAPLIVAPEAPTPPSEKAPPPAVDSSAPSSSNTEAGAGSPSSEPSGSVSSPSPSSGSEQTISAPSSTVPSSEPAPASTPADPPVDKPEDKPPVTTVPAPSTSNPTVDNAEDKPKTDQPQLGRAKEEIPANPAKTTTMINGVPQYDYFVAYESRVILDGLNAGDQVPLLTTKVRWIIPEGITVEDREAVRTFFIAPFQDRDLYFPLQVMNMKESGYTTVAVFRFTVMSEKALSADVNQDGRFDFADLLNLLQHWESFGNEATKVISLILSRYQ